MKNKSSNRFKLTNFLFPGFHHLASGLMFKGLIFISMAIVIAGGAFYLNQHFFLKFLWKLKAMFLPHTLILDFYAAKQATAYNFVYIYLIVGAGAFFDFAFSSATIAQKQPATNGTLHNSGGTSES